MSDVTCHVSQAIDVHPCIRSGALRRLVRLHALAERSDQRKIGRQMDQKQQSTQGNSS